MQAARRLNSGRQFRLDRIRGAPLNDLGIVRLLGLQWSLLSTSSSLYIQGAQVTLAGADSAASQITAATHDANAAIKKRNVIDKVASIGSAAGALVSRGDYDR